MVNINDIVQIFLRESRRIVRGCEMPSTYVQKIVNRIPECRDNLNLQNQFINYHQKKQILLLSNKERICLNMIVRERDYRRMVNEIGHIFLISNREGKRCYFLLDLPELNRKDHLMGDIYVPRLDRKYEVKTFNKLGNFFINRLINQYRENDFVKNEVYFSICFNEVEKGMSIEVLKNNLSNELKIKKSNIIFTSMGELREEVKSVNNILERVYNIEYKDYLCEHEKSTVSNINKLFTSLKTKREKDYINQVLEGHKDNSKIDKNNKRLQKLIKRINLEECGAESSVDNQNVEVDIEIPEYRSIFDDVD